MPSDTTRRMFRPVDPEQEAAERELDRRTDLSAEEYGEALARIRYGDDCRMEVRDGMLYAAPHHGLRMTKVHRVRPHPDFRRNSPPAKAPASEPGKKERTVNRVRIAADGDRHATLTIPPGHVLHDGPDPEAPQVREFRAAWGHSYLREVLPDGRATEVCEQLRRTGPTVAVGENERTVDVVRHEYRAAYRSAKADERANGLSHPLSRRDRAGAADLARRTLDAAGPSRSR